MAQRDDDPLEAVLAAIDPLLDMYLEKGKPALTGQQAQWLAVWMLDAEVNNGGFDQFFWNSGGDLTAEAILGLTAIGAMEKANILAAAAADFPGGTPSANRQVRQTQLDALRESPAGRFEALDRQYYDSRDNPIELLATCIITDE